MLQLILAVLALPVVVLGTRDFSRGMAADDADQWKATAYLKARTAAVLFAVTAVLIASMSLVLAAVFMVLAFGFQFLVPDRLIGPVKDN